MKYLIPILSLYLFLFACTPPETDELAQLKKTLQQKKADLNTLRQEIAEMEEQIADLDTVKVVRPRRLVSTQVVELEDFDRYVEIQGSVQSDDVVIATSEVPGRIVKLNVKEGQRVNKGQLIAKLDMESVDKQIAELQTALDLADEVYDRQKRLWDQNIGSEIQYLQSKNNKERLEKSLESIRFQLTKANIYAPISGMVDHVFTKQGELANPGLPIIDILSTRKVKVVADVPENYLTAVRKGELVTIHFPALGEERKARVSMIGRTIDPSNRTFEVEVELNNQQGVLKPNLLANMMVNDFSQKDAVIIPLELVQQEVSGKSYVFITESGDNGPTAKKIYVEMGESSEGRIIITEGLKGGEELIVEGARGLAENEKIRIDGPAG
ncbi:MAG: efflux RND transporter periplasmic adaptor subunit [Bacteroidota bacterium]